MAEPTPNPSKTTEPTPPTPPTPPEPPAPNNGDNQKAIDDAVAAAKEKWEKELEQKLKDAENEGMRKAKLTNEQRKKEDDDKERAEFEKAKAEFEREKIVRTYIPTIDKESYVSSEVQEVLLPDLVSDNPATGKSTNLWLSACFCMYSMKLILESNWRFASERDIISEDVYSLLRLYRNVEKVTIIPEAFYYYCENSTSLTHTYKADRFNRIKRFYNACIDACDELNYNDEVKKRFSGPFISNTIAAMKMIIQADMSNDKKKSAFKAICKDEQLHKIINSVEVKKEKFTRRLLIWFLKARLYSVCELLVRLKA